MYGYIYQNLPSIHLVGCFTRFTRFTQSHHGITSPAGGFHKDSSMANLLQSRASRVHSDDQFLVLMVGGFAPRKWNFSRLAKSENLYRFSIWKRYLNQLESEWMKIGTSKKLF
jgi:hypothetical protein